MVPFLLLGLFLSHSLDSSPSPHAKIADNCILGYISFFNLHAKMGIIAKYQKLPTCSAIEKLNNFWYKHTKLKLMRQFMY